jgi:hypothetical protein
MNVVNLVLPIVGRFYSNEYVRKKILMQTDEDIETEDRLITAELQNPQFQQTIDPMSGMPMTLQQVMAQNGGQVPDMAAINNGPPGGNPTKGPMQPTAKPAGRANGPAKGTNK